MREELILRIGCKVLAPFILAFGLYVHFHGDYSPGGGFQAGVILAAAFALYGLVFGVDEARRVLPLGVARTLAAAGVLIFGGVGAATVLLGHNFLAYNALAHDPKHAQHYGILLVELGVVVTVFGVMTSIFYVFAGRARDRGPDGGAP